MFYTISNNAVNDFFQDLNSVFKPSSHFSNGKSYKTELTDDGITLTMETPGYNKNLIDVMVEDKTLIIEGKSNTSDTDGFKERFIINDKFDGDGVEASIVDGVLTISLPYKTETKPRKIKVKVG
jgi:HSP20 family molecular chaperone IbpA|tara:strand:+ start:945 stop:1316 length:372 start_codon:yes stop_codon:yes gene_type:complete